VLQWRKTLGDKYYVSVSVEAGKRSLSADRSRSISVQLGLTRLGSGSQTKNKGLPFVSFWFLDGTHHLQVSC